jgi:EmrB/QacA subfamily drug resistance transporter
MSAEPSQAAVAQQPSRANVIRPNLALLLIATAQLMVYLDATIVNVALPHIQGSLGFSGSGLEWVVNAYSVTFGGLLLLGGRSGDRLGRKRVFIAATTAFAIASMAGGLAHGQSWLLAARAVQGAGSAVIAPTSLSLVSTIFPQGPQRNRAMAVYAGATAAGGAIGLIAGGFLVSYLSWRWVFFVNVPIGLGLALGALRVFPETARLRGRFDLPGAVTGTCGVAALVYGLSNAAGSVTGAANWGSPKIAGSLAAAVVLLAAFVSIELRTAEPLLPLRLFRDRDRSGAYLVMLCTEAALYGMFFFLTIFLQEVWGYSALRTAVAYLPMFVSLLGLSAVCAVLIPRTGARPLLIAGSAITAVGMLWISRINEHSTYLHGLLVPMVVATIGFGILFVPMNLVAMAKVDNENSGIASSLLNAGEQIGGSTGLAVLGTVAWTVVADSIRGQLAAAGKPLTGAVPAPVYKQALASGFTRGFEIAAVAVLLGMVSAITLMRVTRQDIEGVRLPGSG